MSVIEMPRLLELKHLFNKLYKGLNCCPYFAPKTPDFQLSRNNVSVSLDAGASL